MKEMTCKLCGYRGGAEESQCPDCGAPLFETLLDLPTETAPEPKEVNITKKRRGRLRLNRSALAAGFLALCLAVQGVGLWRLHRPVDPGWSFVDAQSDQLVTSQGVWSFGDVEVGSVSSNDGPCQVIWTWDHSYDGSSVDLGVYFYDGKSLERTDWTSATISGNGQALFYQTGDVDGEQAITRRDLKTGRELEVARGLGLSMATQSDYAGTAVAYHVYDTTHGDQTIGLACHLWQLGVGSREVEGYLYYLGNHGDNYMAAFHDRSERANEFIYGGSKVAVVWNGGERYTEVTYDMKSDRELTELLYQDDEGWWNYENQEGLAKRLEDLPRHMGLDTVRPNAGDDYASAPAHLTGQVYQEANGGLYYLAQDLSVIQVTPEGVVERPEITADGKTLYCFIRPWGQSAEFWRLTKNAVGGWDGSLLTPPGGASVRDYILSPDGQTLCVRCWDGNSLTWKLFQAEEDRWEDLEGVKGHATTEDVLLMEGGGCWYQGDSSSLHRELWYRSPDGETQLKMAYTSPASSTMYPTDTEAEVPLGMDTLLGLDGFELIDLGRGDQALLRVSYTGLGEVKGKTTYSSLSYARAPERAEYWLLEDDGTMTRLEAIEP